MDTSGPLLVCVLADQTGSYSRTSVEYKLLALIRFRVPGSDSSALGLHVLRFDRAADLARQNRARKIDESDNDRERREILKALGDAALDEHAEWILMHRERLLEIGKL